MLIYFLTEFIMKRGRTMRQIVLTRKIMDKYRNNLVEEEKSRATIEKYMRDIKLFYESLRGGKIVTKEAVVLFKESLAEDYKPSSVNSMLVAVNRFLEYLNIPQCKVRLFKIQKKNFGDASKELTNEEYKKILLAAKAKKNERLYMLIQTICSTGIRVSEHRYITVEALRAGKATVKNKGKIREIFLSQELRKMLTCYCRKNQIHKGAIFITKRGKPLYRSNIWSDMKTLCKDSGVDEHKVFPHNLRHLFAVTYYRLEKDLDTLASLLGHNSVDTTRIYTRQSGNKCTRILSKMQLCLQL